MNVRERPEDDARFAPLQRARPEDELVLPSHM